MQVDMRAQFDAVSAQRRQLNGHLHEHTKRVAYGDDELRELGIARSHKGVGDESHGYDDVVEDGRGRRPQVITRGVEQAAYDGRDAVEHNLHCEESEEEDGVAHCRLVVHEALGVNERRRENGAEQRDETEHNERERKQVRRVFVAALNAEPVFYRNVDGQKCGYQHAAHDKLIEHVGQVVRHLIGACEHGGAQGECHRPRAHETSDTRNNDEE